MQIQVGVLFGGKSVEHEVSVISGIQAIHAFDQTKYAVVPIYITKQGDMYTGPLLDKIEEYKSIPALLKKSQRVLLCRENGQFQLVAYPFKRFGNPVCATIDVAFPVVHGTNVEDGALQGYLKTLGIPFAGCDVLASAVGMDKYVMKTVFRDNRLPVLDCRVLFARQFYKDGASFIGEVEQTIPYPVIVKPVNLGSSVGIKKAGDTAALKEALEYAFQFADMVLVERAVVRLREINCAVLGDRESARASECEEPVGADEILSYADKYMSGGKSASSAKGMSTAKRRLPADLTPAQREGIRTLAVKAFQCLGCSGVARVDLMIDEEDGAIWINEINTIPGSLSFYLWEPLGVTYAALLDEMVGLALKRERENADILYSFESNILAQFKSGGTKGAKL